MTSNFQDLISEDEGLFNAAWGSFFLNVDLTARFLKETPLENLSATLSAGSRWQGTGWNTTRAAKELKRVAGISMVTGSWPEYLGSFLFSLAL